MSTFLSCNSHFLAVPTRVERCIRSPYRQCGLSRRTAINIAETPLSLPQLITRQMGILAVRCRDVTSATGDVPTCRRSPDLVVNDHRPLSWRSPDWRVANRSLRNGILKWNRVYIRKDCRRGNVVLSIGNCQ